MKTPKEILSKISGYSENELAARNTEPLIQPIDCLLAMDDYIELKEQETIKTKHAISVCKLNGRKHVQCWRTDTGYKFITVLLVPVKDLINFNDWQLYRVFKDVALVVKRFHLSKDTIEVMSDFKNLNI